MTERFLRRREAAEYVHGKYGFCSDKTLAKLATVGGGPIYQKAGKFPLEDLDSWAASKLSKPVRSTAEYDAARAMRASDTAKAAPAIAGRSGAPAHDDRGCGGE